MLTTHFARVEADLLRYYRVDLPAGLWGDEPMSARRLSVLVRSLPADSATVLAVHHDQANGTATAVPAGARQKTTDADIAAFGGTVTYVTKKEGI